MQVMAVGLLLLLARRALGLGRWQHCTGVPRKEEEEDDKSFHESLADLACSFVIPAILQQASKCSVSSMKRFGAPLLGF